MTTTASHALAETGAPPTPPQPERMLRDVHPAELSTGTAMLTTGARVMVTTQRVIVYEVDGDGDIHRWSLALVDPLPPRKQSGGLVGSLELHTEDGRTLWMHKGRGCGCGSPLKALSAAAPW